MSRTMSFSIEIEPLDLDLTLGCGQTFRWVKGVDGSWRGPLGKRLITLRPKRKGLEVEVKGRAGGVVKEAVAEYLRAKDDMRSIHRHLSNDPVLADGIASMHGLRIVKMDEWECLASYVLATYANIPRITRMISALSERYGDEIADGVHAFPTIDQLRAASRSALRKCGLGYRADFIHSLCNDVDERRLKSLTKLNYENLREELKELPGVGDKVADCVCLFGFGRLEAFPIDVWIERALKRLYGKQGSYSSLRRFASERFGKYAGYAQEYLYYNERGPASRGECRFSEERGQ